MSATCRSCDAPVHWAETATGRRMPLDVEPVQDLRGRGVQVVFEGVGGRAQCRPYDEAVEAVALRRSISTLAACDYVDETCSGYLSHFVTCPNAGEYRR